MVSQTESQLRQAGSLLHLIKFEGASCLFPERVAYVLKACSNMKFFLLWQGCFAQIKPCSVHHTRPLL